MTGGDTVLWSSTPFPVGVPSPPSSSVCPPPLPSTTLHEGRSIGSPTLKDPSQVPVRGVGTEGCRQTTVDGSDGDKRFTKVQRRKLRGV